MVDRGEDGCKTVMKNKHIFSTLLHFFGMPRPWIRETDACACTHTKTCIR